MRRALLLLAILSPASALADVVVLADGQELRGAVTEEEDTVTIRLDVGSVSFPRSEVAAIKRESTPLHELEQKRARLAADDAGGRLSLARWAEQNDLPESARELYREVLALRPDDPTAREALGYRKYDGRWMTEEEHLASTGHVRYAGRWVRKEESERLEREAAERREKQENDERIRALEAQVALQKEQLEEIESPPETYSSDVLLYDGWWGYSSFGYGFGFPYLQHHPHKRPHVIPPARPAPPAQPAPPARPAPKPRSNSGVLRR